MKTILLFVLSITSLSILFQNLNVFGKESGSITNLSFRNEFFKDSTLTKLDLSNTDLISIPSEINEYKALEELNLSSNPKLELDQSFYELSKVDSLKKMNLSGCKLAYIPFSINELKYLEELNLSQNLIFEIPDMMHKMRNLKYVDLSHNNIEELGYAPSLWKELRTINLKDNPNLNLESAFQGLSYLKKIDKIEVNNISVIPENTPKLKVNDLVFENCDFKSSKVDFSEDCGIKTFSFNDCKKTNFDKILPVIAQNKEIVKLNLVDNNLKRLKIDSIQFPKLSHLDICGNDINKKDLDELQKQFPYCKIVDVKEQTTEQIPSKREVKPPFEQVLIKPTMFSVKPNEEQVLSTLNSKINIPKNAFVDKEGKIITSPVSIQYKEILNPVDQILSGIPMEYDSAGVTYNFESAGMIEFRAESEGEEVFPNPDALIKVELKSEFKDKNYGLYALNDDNGKWDYVESAQQEEINTESTDLLNSRTVLSKPFYKGRPKPTIGSNNISYSIIKDKKKQKYIIGLNYNTDDYIFKHSQQLISFIEMAKLEVPKKEYRKYRLFSNYTYRSKYKDKKHKYYKRFKDSVVFKNARCMGVDLVVNREKDMYEVVLEYNSGEVRIPCLIKSKRNKSSEQKSNQDFWSRFKAGNYGNVKSSIQKEYEKEMDEYEKDLKEFQEKYRKYFQENSKYISDYDKINYAFEMNTFSVWNCDRYSRVDSKKIKVKFKNTLKKVFVPVVIYIINKTKNGFERATGSDHLTYEKECKHSLMLLDKDGNVGLVTPEEFDLTLENQIGQIKTFDYEFVEKEDINQDELLEKLL